MKFLCSVITVMLLIGSVTIYATDYSEEQSFKIPDGVDLAAAEKASVIWQNDLYKYLLAVGGSDIKLMSLTLLEMSDFSFDKYQPLNSKVSFDKKITVLNDVLEDDRVSVQSLITARSLCDDLNDMTPCDVEAFNQKLFKQDPKNLNIYFHELNQAVEQSDPEMVSIILKQMSEAKYSKNLISLPVELNTIIETYMEENPISTQVGSGLINSLPSHINESNLETLMQQNILQVYYLSHLMYLPNFRALMVACEEFQQNDKLCQPIADVMKNHSDTMLMITLGYDLEEKLATTRADTKLLEAIQAEYQAFKNYQACVLSNHALILNPMFSMEAEFVEIMTQGGHEGRNLERAAIHLYNEYNVSNELTDPVSCGLRYTDAN